MSSEDSRPTTPPPLNVDVDDEPTTPPNPSVKLTLPTPPSFSANRARAHSITSPDSPAKVDDSPVGRKKGHSRSVSFNQDVEIKTISPEVNRYIVPQRKLSLSRVNDEGMEVLSDLVSPITRRGPPSALLLGKSNSTSSLRSPFRGAPKSAPVLPLQARGTSRFSSTAAARGISIAPTLAKLKENKTKNSSGAATGLPGMKSIWSAGLTASGGWITPGLGSARTPTSAAAAQRQRGLSVAVIKDGKEMLVESGPITPGLPSGRKVQDADAQGDQVQPLSAKSPGKPRESKSRSRVFW